MGAWDIGPFENDNAADFAAFLDDAEPSERGEILRRVLAAVADSTDYLESDEGAEAVAAAALIASQLPGGAPVSPAYGPKQPLPPLPPELRALAAAALGRVLGADSELAELWGETEYAETWRSDLGRLTTVLTGA
ncbi:DUF4259 domain-containing protein [Kitasatospora sp. NPDC051853]|uniref:DUF4259 domain-containing protein n=1 Tax=Kitasatospora sp. NPDC051853 TaxID=3364058 RepID=UPI0037A24533